MRPAALVTDIDVVEMRVEHHRRRFTPATNQPDHVPHRIGRHLVIAECLHLGCQQGCGLSLLAGQPGRSNQALQELDTSIQVVHRGRMIFEQPARNVPMLKLTKVFTRGVLQLAPFWWLWLGALMVVNIAMPLMHLETVEARIVLVAVAVGMLIQFSIIARLGFVRLLGLGHILWLPMLPWLAIRLAEHGLHDAFGNWLLALIVIDTISVAIDIADVTRWIRGERTPTVTLADVS
jgi:hypothetical protein